MTLNQFRTEATALNLLQPPLGAQTWRVGVDTEGRFGAIRPHESGDADRCDSASDGDLRQIVPLRLDAVWGGAAEVQNWLYQDQIIPMNHRLGNTLS